MKFLIELVACSIFISLFLFKSSIIYADHPIYTINCIGGGTMQTIDPPGPCNKCWSIECKGGGTRLVGFPEFCGDIPPGNPQCDNSPQSPTPTPNPAIKPTCNEDSGDIVCRSQWAMYRNYLNLHAETQRDVQKANSTPTATPSVSPTAPTYLSPTITPTPKPSLSPIHSPKPPAHKIVTRTKELPKNFILSLSDNFNHFVKNIYSFLTRIF